MVQAPMPPPPVPPPPPHHPNHQRAFLGVQSLPVEFDHLTLGTPIPHHPGHQRMSPPSPGGFGGLGQDFDSSLLRKEKDSLEGYNYERVEPQNPHEKVTWARATKTKMPLSQAELLAMANKQKRKGPTAWQFLKSDEMKGWKRTQVDQLIEQRMRAEPRFTFNLAGLKLDQYTDRRRGVRGTSAFQVILRRQLRKDLSSAGPAGLGNLHEPHREVVDLTGGSEDPSEGSSQGFFGAGSPPPHFRPPPQHGFPDHPGLGHPPHQPPFMFHPEPPMRDVHHEVHRHDVQRTSPPPHPMHHFEGPFIHQDPHQADASPLFDPHMRHQDPHQADASPSFNPPMRHQTPPFERNEENRREAKAVKHPSDHKGFKNSKPAVHQSPLHKSGKKHKEVRSESDWDYLSESSFSSQAYSDRTPDTSHSSNSFRKDKKSYHKGGHGRRHSQSHHEDHSDRRHEQVYRVHRRKPTMSPDRARPSGPSRHEVEVIEVIPATHMRKTRPYVTRSRTTAYLADHLPELDDRPALHTRHTSYDDERHHGLRGLTPPGRRGSVNAPKRTTALDFYDVHEQQERMEREEIKRELLREKYRKEELRESVARQLEREAEEMRRLSRRDRGVSSDVLYDERPGRYSRGYENDRFMY